MFHRIIGQAASSQPTDSFLLSRYHFRILDSFGWNFRHAHFHEEGRRTLYKAFGIKFVIIVQGRAGEKIIFVVNGPSGHCSQFKLHSPPEIQQSSLLPLLMICRKQNEQPDMQGQAWTLIKYQIVIRTLNVGSSFWTGDDSGLPYGTLTFAQNLENLL